MKIACISDTHGLFLPEIPDDADIVLHAGDVGPDRNALDWLEGPFSDWAERVGRPIYCTWGNHDFFGERGTIFDYPDNVSFWVDAEAVYNGVKMWFSPWSNRFGNWAFMESEADLARRWERIPEDTQIIVSHGPPKGYGDRIFWDGHYQEVGSKSLLDRFLSLPEASLLVCGHIHEAAGRYQPAPGKLVVNASQVDEFYDPVQNAVQIVEF